MSLGIKAMTANYAALQATGHNIANANVKGYSRQQVGLATSEGQYTGAGFFGRGVDVTTVTRAHDEFMTREAAASSSVAAMDSARLDQLKRMESVFKTGEAGLGYAASALFNSMVDLSNSPADSSARQVVLARAADMAGRFDEAGSALDTLQAGVGAELRSAVADINSLAKSIAATNERIAALRGLGQPANDVLDERERVIGKLADQVTVSRVEADDGSLSIFIGGGRGLVIGNRAGELRVTTDPTDPLRNAIGIVDGPALRPLESQALGGGAVAGLLRFQNEDLVEGRNLVGRLALAVGGAVNQQQMRGLTLRPPLGSAAAPALFAMGPSQGLPNALNAKDAAGIAIGSVALAVTDPAALQPSDYDLRESPTTPGSWQLTRLADGTVSTVNSGDVVDGFRVDIGNPQPGDRFLLQPVARGANGMRALLTDPRDVAAASPLVATTAAANTGTAAVASLVVNATPLPVAGGTATFTFTSDSGDYDWAVVDASNAVVASGSAVWRPGVAMPAAPLDINGFALQLSGVPRSGDVVTVLPTPVNSLTSNNGNANAMLALRDVALAAGATVGDSWSQAMSGVGVRVQTAQTASDISAAVAQQADQSRSSQAGVNLDEEGARLIQYQQSYQAAAKVLQVAQALFDTLLQVGGR